MSLLEAALKLLPAVGPVVAALPEFKDLYDRLLGSLNEPDQEALKASYADAIEGSDEAHARLQATLASLRPKPG